MRKEIELYEMIYKYVNEVDPDEFENVDKYTHRFRISNKPRGINDNDPYGEDFEDLDKDAIIIKVMYSDTARSMLHMNDEPLTLNQRRVDRLHRLIKRRIEDKKAIQRKKRMEEMLKTIKH